MQFSKNFDQNQIRFYSIGSIDQKGERKKETKRKEWRERGGEAERLRRGKGG